MEHILGSLLYRSNITTVDKQDLFLQLLSHNEYPSIKAVTDTLDYFGIDSIAANVPTDALAQMPEYFLALQTKKGLSELVLVKKKPNKIQYTDQANNKHTKSYDEFSQNWTGTIIAIEKEEKRAVSKLKAIRAATLLMALSITLLLVLVSLSGMSIVSITYLMLSTIGLIISYYTTKEELGIKDKVTTKVCGAISGDVHGCSNVINSREGKIFGVLPFVDASLLFFATTFLFTLLFGANNIINYSLAVLAIPVVALSVYLQSVRLKQFCLLCLLTSAVLISQFVLLQATFSNWDFSFPAIISYAFIFCLSTLVWLTIKKFWRDSNTLKGTLQEYYRFKRNSEFFINSLQKLEPYKVEGLATEFQISFGNPNALVKISAVTNPLCGYCKEPFEAYDNLLTLYPNDVQLNLIFNVPLEIENKSNQIVTRILEMYQEHPAEAYKALQDWFSTRNLENWQNRYGISNSMLLAPQGTIEAHSNWCRANKIQHTPESIINGYPFPKTVYKIADLQFFIEPLKEPIKNSEKKLVI